MRCSIVIPFYNSEAFLSKCLESIVRSIIFTQKPQDFEIILVDNGSEDDSLKIATLYKNQNPSLIRLVHCARKGAAAARNYGLQYTSGDYVWFIDADDWIEPISLSKISEAIEQEPDLITIAATKDYELLTGKNTQPRILNPISSEMDDWANRFIMYGFGPWQCIMRKQWAIDNKLLYHEGIIHEDIALLPTIPLFTNNVIGIKDVLYHYVQHNNSVLHKSTWNDNAYDIFTALDDVYLTFKARDLKQQHAAAVEYLHIWNLLIDTARNFARFPEGKSGYSQIRSTMKERYPNWNHNPYFKNRSLGFQLRCYMGYAGEWGIYRNL